MTQSRQPQMSLSDTPYYHCISRCAGCAYLCGEKTIGSLIVCKMAPKEPL